MNNDTQSKKGHKKRPIHLAAGYFSQLPLTNGKMLNVILEMMSEQTPYRFTFYGIETENLMTFCKVK